MCGGLKRKESNQQELEIIPTCHRLPKFIHLLFPYGYFFLNLSNIPNLGRYRSRISFNMLSHPFSQISYPFEQSTAEKIQSVLFISLFLSLLLFLLQPFGFVPLSRVQFLSGYLAITVVTFLVNYIGIPFFLPQYFVDQSWSVAKAFLFFLYNFFQMGLWIHIFNTLVMHNDPSEMASGTELLITITKALILGAVASSFLILIRYNWITRQNLQASQDLNQKMKDQLQLYEPVQNQTETIFLVLEGKSVDLPRRELAYIRSEGNYLSFHFDPSYSKSPLLIRGRIKELEEALSEYPEFFRCHRSFIVGLPHISSSQGNSQGLSIQLRSLPERLPVSRPKIKVLKRHIEGQVRKK